VHIFDDIFASAHTQRISQTTQTSVFCFTSVFFVFSRFYASHASTHTWRIPKSFESGLRNRLVGHLSSHAFYSSFPFILSCLYFLHMCVFRLFPFYVSLASAHTSTSAQAHHRCSGAYPSMSTREWRTCYFARDRAFLGTSGSGPQRPPRHLWRIPRRIPAFFVLPRAPGIRQKEFTHIYIYIYIYIYRV
jgi:hypothetical protein